MYGPMPIHGFRPMDWKKGLVASKIGPTGTWERALGLGDMNGLGNMGSNKVR
jgi:hypothetical protein